MTGLARTARRGADRLAGWVAGWVAGIAAAGLLLAGCGVPLEGQAQPLPADVLPAASPTATASRLPTAVTGPTSTSSPAPPASGLEAVRLWYVGDSGLVPVASAVPADAGPQALIDLLAAGPPPGDAARGLRSVVADPSGSGPLVRVADLLPTPTGTAAVPDQVTVWVADAFTGLPPAEQVLVLGQVVLTLGDAGASSVVVTDAQGVPLAVPLPDGRLLDRPATPADYAALVAP